MIDGFAVANFVITIPLCTTLFFICYTLHARIRSLEKQAEILRIAVNRSRERSERIETTLRMVGIAGRYSHEPEIEFPDRKEEKSGEEEEGVLTYPRSSRPSAIIGRMEAQHRLAEKEKRRGK